MKRGPKSACSMVTPRASVYCRKLSELPRSVRNVASHLLLLLILYLSGVATVTGFWRMHRLFTSKKVPVTVFAAGMVSHDLVSCAPFCVGVFPFLAHTYIDRLDDLIMPGARTQSGRLPRSEGDQGLGSRLAWVSLDRLCQCRRGDRAGSHLAHGANSRPVAR
jgi:hypothetical protein